MLKNELISIFKEFGISPNKHLGQNFLTDNNFLEYIVRTANPKDSDFIIEVGPGFGMLTNHLLEAGAQITAIEFDRKIATYLKENLRHSNFTLIEGDACKIDLGKIIPEGREYRIIANLPYAISSPFISKICEMEKLPENMLLMLQQETAQRFNASSGTKHYNSISIQTQILFDIIYYRKVPPQVFFPQPEIESTLVGFFRKQIIPTPVEREQLISVTKTAFRQRRKKMFKQLARKFGDIKTTHAFNTLKIDLNCRAENLTPTQFLQLTELLLSDGFVKNSEFRTS